jgi:protein-disulfide isomerase
VAAHPAVVASLGLLLISSDLAAQQPTSTAVSTRSKGSAAAPVTVYEMSDFQCPYCRRFALETFRSLEREYISTGRVRWVFVNFPLTSIHANAVAAAGTALCASRQGAFWPVHDLLYTYQDTWAPLKEPGPFLLSLADSAGISRPKLLECVKSPTTESEIRYEARGAERAGATSTPTFYIEGGLLTGAQPLPVFRQVLDSIYRLKRRPPPASR